MNSKTTPRDFFLHLSATVVLYVAAGSLITLAFSIINYFRPDALAGSFYAGSMVWPISMLVVLVPILYALEWIIAKDVATMPEKKDIWIRRWRIYLTLFLAAALIIGDLIALINTYLNGEITSRFVYKVIAVILVSSTIGKYYFFSMYDQYRKAAWTRRFTTWFGVVLVVAAIIGGFAIVGSPSKQRALRFDQERINDLSNIQWQIINNWQTKGALPAHLDDLEDPLSGVAIPTDPETEEPYAYSVKNSQTFELCAVFGQPTQDNEGRGDFGYGGGISLSRPYPYYPYPEGEQWDHEAGRTCFERTIDPARYPVNPKPIPVDL